jgi:hypothetical protein
VASRVFFNQYAVDENGRSRWDVWLVPVHVNGSEMSNAEATATAQRLLHDSRLEASRIVARVSVVPPVACYVLGWALGWVYRGFRPKKSDEAQVG